MKLDDIIGILFLLFFILGPALKGLFKPAEPVIELEIPEENSNQAITERASRTEPLQPAGPPASKPAREPAEAQAAAHTRPVDEGLENKSRPPKQPGGGKRRKRKLGLKTGRRAVLNGMLWHEILSEPVAFKLREHGRHGAKLE
ncbi:hypothetical protein [Oceanithermus sp.]